ncbi:hypothetical protein BGX26_002518 [Mortierella sp. AD094]|nr:hypothetical protein BGX26_002518 [Mortierella sp. AD094]
MYNSVAKLLLFGFAFFFTSILFIQFYQYTSEESNDLQLPSLNNIVEASFESRRPLQIPITIVTAASANHACALEAFLYHINATLSQLHTSPKDDLRMREMRIKKSQQYLETSLDLKEVRRAGKEIPQISLNAETIQDSSDGTTYEIRPKVVVYNMGMGPTKKKKVQFRAMIEAGYIDEIFDFDFNKYPDFWKLGTVTRGEYGWKAGIIEEVSRRVLESPEAESMDVGKSEPELTQEPAAETMPNKAKLEDEEIRKWAAIEEQVDEGPTSLEDENELGELENSNDILQHNYRVSPNRNTTKGNTNNLVSCSGSIQETGLVLNSCVGYPVSCSFMDSGPLNPRTICICGHTQVCSATITTHLTIFQKMKAIAMPLL